LFYLNFQPTGGQVFCTQSINLHANLFFYLFIDWLIDFYYSFIHMCIHCLGHLPPQAQASPVLPLSLVLLKKRDKHNKEDKGFLFLELRIAIQKYS
jgi:hypothetical protein